MIRPTELQASQQAFLAVLLDARVQLDEVQFRVFVDYLCAVIAQEAARCENWEHRHGGEAA